METPDSSDIQIKRLIWLYFWLLIFEGALRKWILPSFSTPLLIVRDPVVILIYMTAFTSHKVPRNTFFAWILGLGFFCLLASFAGMGNTKVTLYGLRTDFLHLPLIFIIPQVFTPDDARKVGKWILILSVPMALLAFEQFRSPPYARLNAGAGGELGAQLFAASGKIRPAGTFSFVTGMVSFLSLTAVFILFDYLQKKQYPPMLRNGALLAIGLSLGVSGSRSAVLTVSMVLAAGLIACLLKGKVFSSALKPLLAIYAVFLLLSLLPVFKEGMAVQQERFQGAGGFREGIIDRLFGDFTAGFSAAATSPTFGYGLGIGTNAGAGIMVGTRSFLLAEGEWARVVMESGPILGFAFIGLRFAILFYILRRVLNALNRGQVLPLLLLGMLWLEMIAGQFGQPTAMGFVIFVSGLCLAAARDMDAPVESSGAEDHVAVSRLAGRSRYAERLHGTS